MKYTLAVLHRAADTRSSVRQIGEFETLDDAVAAAKQQVETVLLRVYSAGMTSSQLIEKYKEEGETPYLARDDEGTMNAHSFNHFQFAKLRSDEICAGAI
jgi:hypothetical protein